MNDLQTLKGFRDFLPNESRKRSFALGIIKNTFELFGFEPLETPALEYQSLLLGKYGTEADKLVYKFEDEGGRKIALRYDQTVPTARILATNSQNLPLPWKRYQIQPVWRTEKPQKGRYREFYQCDIDIFGSTSPIADAEILAASFNSLKNLGFKNIKLFINDRQILFDLMKAVGVKKENQLTTIQTIDKLDKKSEGEVKNELSQKGLDEKTIKDLFEKLKNAKETDNLSNVIDDAIKLGVKKESIEFHPFLARGLDYYTSTIFEFVLTDYVAGSVAGGGRYDNLIADLSGVDMPAVGLAFGFDRLIEAMDENDLFPKNLGGAGVLVTIFDDKFKNESFDILGKLREAGVPSEIYAGSAKLDKQLKYANKKGVSFVTIIGPDEARENKILLKNMESGKQEKLTYGDLVKKLTS